MTNSIQNAESGDPIAREFSRLIEAAYQVSEEVGEQVTVALRVAQDRPLTTDEAQRLLRRIITEMRASADRRGDTKTTSALSASTEEFIQSLVSSHDRISASSPPGTGTKRLELEAYNSISPHAVKPTPVFHERQIPVMQGFVRTRDIALWDDNARLDIHLAQFQRLNGRKPKPDELLDLMQSKLRLQGVDEGTDQFEIETLARSIAVNGVRKPPIIDVDGTLLDGNRRLAACHLILDSDDYNSDEKKRVERLLVWQLTEHATDDDREAVIVSLNFEPDYKQDWPEYVKARKVFEEWQSCLARESRGGGNRVNEIKREISKKFALGPDASHVNRYIKMVELADEFEGYHVIERKKDKFEVKHRSEKYFQYFDELSKGTRPGGVNFAINQDDTFKHTVFDLLFDGKFSNWTKIRPLRNIAESPDARDFLKKAREETDVDNAQDLVDDAIAIVQAKRAELRMVGANDRIEKFVDWFEDLPLKAFTDQISRNSLIRLRTALKVVESRLEDLPEQ